MGWQDQNGFGLGMRKLESRPGLFGGKWPSHPHPRVLSGKGWGRVFPRRSPAGKQAGGKLFFAPQIPIPPQLSGELYLTSLPSSVVWSNPEGERSRRAQTEGP